MKAISLWEPWATLIRMGVKPHETRSWYTNYRGELLICAAKGGISKSKLKDYLYIFKLFFEKYHIGIKPPTIDDLHFGHAVAVVTLTEIKQTNFLYVAENVKPTGNYESGRYAWILEDIRPIDPFPVKGKQGFFNVDFKL